MLEDVDPTGITDLAEARRVLGRVLNLVEELHAKVATLTAENQRLRDENNRLKGEQGKPRILPRTRTKEDQSSERERRETPKTWHKRAKLPDLHIDRVQECRLDRGTLPEDAVLKDYQEHTVQDLVLHTETILFRRERYAAASTGHTYTAPLPPGYAGEFGPNLQASAVYLHYQANVSQPQVHRLFTSLGLRISRGYLGQLLSEQPGFAAEAEAIGQAGVASSQYAHLDVTPTRVNGVEHQCHVLGGPLYVFYHTTLHKHRLAAIETLQVGAPCQFRFTPVAWNYLEQAAVPAAVRWQLAALGGEQVWDWEGWRTLLTTQFPALGDRLRERLWDAGAIGYYRAQAAVPVLETLVCDDAPQFKGITADLSLCWVHEGRHYKKLSPVVPLHLTLLEAFRGRFWDYYRELRAYQKAPTAHEAVRLEAAFDTLFATQTGYAALDERIAKTAAKKHALLRVLEKPYLPLTNNPAELAARRRVRKRDVSFGARSPAGIKAWDVFHTIVGTAQLLEVNVLHYLRDRFSGACHLPALADLIRQRTAAPTAALDAAAA
jgi:regulator of replication initiation timing